MEVVELQKKSIVLLYAERIKHFRKNIRVYRIPSKTEFLNTLLFSTPKSSWFGNNHSCMIPWTKECFFWSKHGQRSAKLLVFLTFTHQAPPEFTACKFSRTTSPTEPMAGHCSCLRAAHTPRMVLDTCTCTVTHATNKWRIAELFILLCPANKCTTLGCLY